MAHPFETICNRLFFEFIYCINKIWVSVRAFYFLSLTLSLARLVRSSGTADALPCNMWQNIQRLTEYFIRFAYIFYHSVCLVLCATHTHANVYYVCLRVRCLHTTASPPVSFRRSSTSLSCRLCHVSMRHVDISGTHVGYVYANAIEPMYQLKYVRDMRSTRVEWQRSGWRAERDSQTIGCETEKEIKNKTKQQTEHNNAQRA